MKIKTIVKESFNDKYDNLRRYNDNDPIILEESRYDSLLSKGKIYQKDDVFVKQRLKELNKKENKED